VRGQSPVLQRNIVSKDYPLLAWLAGVQYTNFDSPGGYPVELQRFMQIRCTVLGLSRMGNITHMGGEGLDFGASFGSFGGEGGPLPPR